MGSPGGGRLHDRPGLPRPDLRQPGVSVVGRRSHVRPRGDRPARHRRRVRHRLRLQVPGPGRHVRRRVFALLVHAPPRRRRCVADWWWLVFERRRFGVAQRELRGRRGRLAGRLAGGGADRARLRRRACARPASTGLVSVPYGTLSGKLPLAREEGSYAASVSGSGVRGTHGCRGVGSPRAAACTNDVDCPTAACGGEVCQWSASGHACVSAGTDPQGSDGWCTADTDCKCMGEGATCVSPHCTFTLPRDGGSSAADGGGGGSSSSGGGYSSGGGSSSGAGGGSSGGPAEVPDATISSGSTTTGNSGGCAVGGAGRAPVGGLVALACAAGLTFAAAAAAAAASTPVRRRREAFSPRRRRRPGAAPASGCEPRALRPGRARRPRCARRRAARARRPPSSRPARPRAWRAASARSGSMK